MAAVSSFALRSYGEIECEAQVGCIGMIAYVYGQHKVHEYRNFESGNNCDSDGNDTNAYRLRERDAACS